jgi:conjugal transfer/entry exclusion protein
MKLSERFTRAFTSALMADLSRNRALASAVASGRISPSKLKEDALRGAVEGVKGRATNFRYVADVVREEVRNQSRKTSGMGEETAGSSVWGAIGSAIAGAATIASNVLTTKYKSEGEAAVAKLASQSQALALQAQQIAAENARRSAEGSGDGIPSWVLPVSIGGGLLAIGGLYLATRGGR